MRFAAPRMRMRTPGMDIARACRRLDGKTRDRQARVERFQANGCPLFFVSLQTAGLGLNLTAAEYVFLLDPWWNPAVETQATARAAIECPSRWFNGVSRV